MNNKELFSFASSMAFYLQSVKEGSRPEGKAAYAIRKNAKRIERPITDKANGELEDMKISFASVDDKQNILRNEKGGYVYTKDNLKALNKQISEWFDKSITGTMPELHKVDADEVGFTPEEREDLALMILEKPVVENTSVATTNCD